ncbi:MAG: cell division protein FtsA, partial [Mesorhizobium sp.]
RRILGRNVRIGLPEAAKGPAFSTPVGLLIYPQMASFESHSAKGLSGFRMTGTGGKLHRMSQWLRDSF